MDELSSRPMNATGDVILGFGHEARSVPKTVVDDPVQ